MKKRSLLKRISGIVLCVLIVISALPIFPVTAKAVTLAEIPEKDWTGYTPVSTKEELAAIKNNPYGNYYLTCDINFTWQDFAEGGAFYNNNEGWVPIGRGFTKVPSAITSQAQFNSAREKYGELYLRQAEFYDYIPLDISYVSASAYTKGQTYYYLDAFYGTIDGNGHTVSNLRTDTVYGDHTAFVGINFGVIENLSITDSNVSSIAWSGVVCAQNYGVISDCYASGNAFAKYRCGGISGVNYGYIYGCESSVSVRGSECLGGITGINSGVIKGCKVSDTAYGDYFIGGICGIAYGSTIADCILETHKKHPYGGTSLADGEGGYIGAIAGYDISDEEIVNFYDNCHHESYLGDSVGNLSIDQLQGGSVTIAEFYSGFGSDKLREYLEPYFDFENCWYFDEKKALHPIGCYFSNEFDISAVWDGTKADGFSSGSGAPEDPFVISDASQLAYLSGAVARGEDFSGKYIELCNDIVLNDTSISYWYKTAAEWSPIGIADNPFEGNFNGNGFSIIGVYVNGYFDMTDAGLFGVVNNGTICNVSVDGYIRSYESSGGLCATAYNTEITDCHIKGFAEGSAFAGLVCAVGSSVSISGCTADGNVKCENIAGGISSYVDSSSSVSQCANFADVEVSYMIAGGICGTSYGNITDCYNTGNIRSLAISGGICGEFAGVSLRNCYSIGSSFADYYVGAICGYAEDGAVVNCYYLEGSAKRFNGETQYGIGCDSAENAKADAEGVATPLYISNFKYEHRYTGFDFKNVWTMGGDGEYKYAKLKRMVTPPSGDVNGDGAVNSIDSNILKRYLVDSTAKINEYNADLNFDGELNSVDSNLIKRMIAGSSL